MTQDELISIFCGFLPYLNKFFAAIQKIIGGELFFLTDITHSWRAPAVSFGGYTIHLFSMLL